MSIKVQYLKFLNANIIRIQEMRMKKLSDMPYTKPSLKRVSDMMVEEFNTKHDNTISYTYAYDLLRKILK